MSDRNDMSFAPSPVANQVEQRPPYTELVNMADRASPHSSQPHGLPSYLDLDKMTAYLQPLLSSSNARYVVTDVNMLDHKPGKRGVVRYHLTAATGAKEMHTVLGKFYRSSAQAKRVHDLLVQLYSSVYKRTQQLGVPKPVGYIPELTMLLYQPVVGQALDQSLVDSSATHLMRQTGIWLAYLHKQQIPIAKRFQFATELNTVADWVDIIGDWDPEMKTAARQIAGYLADGADESQFQSQTPIHKDFHFGHVIVSDTLNVIDFDEARLGDPNFDLAHFCANWQLLAYRHRDSTGRYRKLLDIFMKSYAQHQAWKPNKQFSYFYAYSCLKVARQLCTNAGPHPACKRKVRQEQVKFMLQQARQTDIQYI